MLARLMLSWPLPLALFVVFAIGAVVAIPVILWLISWQRRLAVGQQIYEDGPSSHVIKAGTPTMGGLAFVAAAVTGTLLFADPLARATPLLLLVLAAATIGFADDYLKLAYQRALGLRARTKFVMLLLVACAFVAWEAHSHTSMFGNSLRMQWWFGEWPVLPTWLWATLAIAAIVGAANAVNLTDGLDGLAAGTALPPLVLLTWVSSSVLGAAVAGACATFLFFNRHPARIFMGDTGSLTLGALLGGLAIEYGMLLLLPLVGLVFVAETLSVILQVVFFKITGRRIFKMSPLHHHFEMSGWTETSVTTTFIVASLIASVAVLVSNPWLWSFARGYVF